MPAVENNAQREDSVAPTRRDFGDGLVPAAAEAAGGAALGARASRLGMRGVTAPKPNAKARGPGVPAGRNPFVHASVPEGALQHRMLQ